MDGCQRSTRCLSSWQPRKYYVCGITITYNLNWIKKLFFVNYTEKLFESEMMTSVVTVLCVSLKIRHSPVKWKSGLILLCFHIHPQECHWIAIVSWQSCLPVLSFMEGTHLFVPKVVCTSLEWFVKSNPWQWLLWSQYIPLTDPQISICHLYLQLKHKYWCTKCHANTDMNYLSFS